MQTSVTCIVRVDLWCRSVVTHDVFIAFVARLLVASRSVMFDSWQREVAKLRQELSAQSSQLSSSESSLNSMQDELNLVKVEVEYLSTQNAELQKECAARIPASKLTEAEKKHGDEISVLRTQLEHIRDEMTSILRAHDTTRQAYAKCQVELQMAQSALVQAQQSASTVHQAKYAYLEEKLQKKEAALTQLQADKRNMQNTITEMEQQIILLRHGLAAHPTSMHTRQPSAPTMYNGVTSVAASPPATSAAAASTMPSSSVPSSSPSLSSAPPSISNILFGSSASRGTVPMPAYRQGSILGQAASRPQPLQLPRYSSLSAMSHANPSTHTLQQTAATTSAPSSVLHQEPIPPIFSQTPAAILTQQLHTSHPPSPMHASTSSSSSRSQSRFSSVAPTPSRPTSTNAATIQHHAHDTARQSQRNATSQVVPPLHLPSEDNAHAHANVGMHNNQGEKENANFINQPAKPLSSSSSSPSRPLSHKLSHLAALSARLLDDDDDERW